MRTLGKLLLAWVILASTFGLYIWVSPTAAQKQKLEEIRRSGLRPEPSFEERLERDVMVDKLCARGVIRDARCR